MWYRDIPQLTGLLLTLLVYNTDHNEKELITWVQCCDHKCYNLRTLKHSIMQSQLVEILLYLWKNFKKMYIGNNYSVLVRKKCIISCNHFLLDILFTRNVKHQLRIPRFWLTFNRCVQWRSHSIPITNQLVISLFVSRL